MLLPKCRPKETSIYSRICLAFMAKRAHIKHDTILLLFGGQVYLFQIYFWPFYVGKFWPKNHKNCNQNAAAHTIYEQSERETIERDRASVREGGQVLITSKRESSPEAATSEAW